MEKELLKLRFTISFCSFFILYGLLGIKYKYVTLSILQNEALPLQILLVYIIYLLVRIIIKSKDKFKI